MNALNRLLQLGESEKKKLGVEYTPVEIEQQPGVWKESAELLQQQKEEIRTFLGEAGLLGTESATLVLTGAGSSEFVGNAIHNWLRVGFSREVLSIPTTHLVTHAESTLLVGRPYTVVSFARSGNSPESVATYDRVRKLSPQAHQVVITCNSDGDLANRAASDPRALSIVLPERTHDRSLVMTSSYSTMAWTAACLPLIETPSKRDRLLQQICSGASRVLQVYPDLLEQFGRLEFQRAAYLGSGNLTGTMQESALKMMEMTDGQVATRFDSFLGVRHGPQVFIDDSCVVIAGLSSDARIRRYELDLLQELKTKNQGLATLVVCDRLDEEISETATHAMELFPEGDPPPDDFRVMTDVIVGQLLGTFKSLSLGLRPDAPSASGVINRVVQGVMIYDE